MEVTDGNLATIVCALGLEGLSSCLAEACQSDIIVPWDTVKPVCNDAICPQLIFEAVNTCTAINRHTV